MLIKLVNTLFSGKKSGFVHIISLTKSAVYGIIRAYRTVYSYAAAAASVCTGKRLLFAENDRFGRAGRPSDTKEKYI